MVMDMLADLSTYVFTQPAARSTRMIFHRLLVNWHSRRRLAKLMKLNDRLLQDIGLKREDLDRAVNRRLAGDGPDKLRRILLLSTD
jgi:uncharacterized protein YjiS (DUF1127 family)